MLIIVLYVKAKVMQTCEYEKVKAYMSDSWDCSVKLFATLSLYNVSCSKKDPMRNRMLRHAVHAAVVPRTGPVFPIGVNHRGR